MIAVQVDEIRRCRAALPAPGTKTETAAERRQRLANERVFRIKNERTYRIPEPRFKTRHLRSWLEGWGQTVGLSRSHPSEDRLEASKMDKKRALIADAFHALTDLVSDFMTLGTVAWALKPPTPRFPSGYGKIESLGSLGVSGLLLTGGVLIESGKTTLR